MLCHLHHQCISYAWNPVYSMWSEIFSFVIGHRWNPLSFCFSQSWSLGNSTRFSISFWELDGWFLLFLWMVFSRANMELSWHGFLFVRDNIKVSCCWKSFHHFLGSLYLLWYVTFQVSSFYTAHVNKVDIGYHFLFHCMEIAVSNLFMRNNFSIALAAF